MDLFDQKNISPMLLYEVHEPFDDEEYIFELKLDGIRCIAYLDKDTVVLQNKRYKNLIDTYPELSHMNQCVNKRIILDGELVLLLDGKPNFYALQKRSLMQESFRIKLASKKNPVQFVAYDILYCDGKELMDLPLLKRKSILSKEVKEKNHLSISRYVETNGKELFHRVKEQNLEGIVAKKKDGKYFIGKRTRQWIKIKVMQDEDVFICGYQLDQNENVKDLILGKYDENTKLICKGKVFLGVSKQERKIIKEFSKENTIKKPWFSQYKNVIWLKLKLVGTIHFMHENENGSLRQPVWKGIRID